MKHSALIAPFLVAAFASVAFGDSAAQNSGLYGRRIIVDVKSNDPPAIAAKVGVPQAKAAADELGGWLEKITGKKFEVLRTGRRHPRKRDFLVAAQVLQLVAQADRDRLKDKGLEAFILHGDSSTLQIIANDWRGVTHGAYTYLEQLGVRWLMAGANWTVVPRRDDITIHDGPARRAGVLRAELRRHRRILQQLVGPRLHRLRLQAGQRASRNFRPSGKNGISTCAMAGNRSAAIPERRS